ncbi:MAG TPA: hypothetical protein VKQ31_05455, partial [Steroidobacteraceae bacterium]|nr:hypothetical protein [Steroidobacteraceae bacterium]
TGMSFLNIDSLHSEKGCAQQGAKRAYYDWIRPAQGSNDRKVMLGAGYLYFVDIKGLFILNRN